MTREISQSIHIGSENDPVLITIVTVRSNTTVGLRITRWLGGQPSDHTLNSGERMQIDPNVSVSIVDIRGEKVRIGIVAPNTMPVHRLEVYEAIKRAQGDSDEGAGGLGVRVPKPNSPRGFPPASVKMNPPDPN